jgi:hypothetical protein
MLPFIRFTLVLALAATGVTSAKPPGPKPAASTAAVGSLLPLGSPMTTHGDWASIRAALIELTLEEAGRSLEHEMRLDHLFVAASRQPGTYDALGGLIPATEQLRLLLIGPEPTSDEFRIRAVQRLRWVTMHEQVKAALESVARHADEGPTRISLRLMDWIFENDATLSPRLANAGIRVADLRQRIASIIG